MKDMNNKKLLVNVTLVENLTTIKKCTLSNKIHAVFLRT